MTITREQEAYIIKLIVGLYHVAPGKQYLEEYSTLVEDGMSQEELAEQLAESPAYIDGMLDGDVSTATQVALLLKHFGLAPGHDDPESVDRLVEGYLTSEFESGNNAGEIIVKIINYLDGEVAEAFIPLQTLYHNKVRVADAYSAEEYSADPNLLYGLTGDTQLDDEQINDIIAQTQGEREEEGFTVLAGIEGIQYAQALRDEFLTEAAQDPETPGMEPPLTEQDIADALTNSIAAVDALLVAAGTAAAGEYIAATGNVVLQEALVAQAIAANEVDKVNANSALTAATAGIEAVPGLSDALAALTAANEAEAAALLDVPISFNSYDSAEITYNDGPTVVDVNETTGGDGMPIIAIAEIAAPNDILVISNGSGNLELAAGVTETNHPGITALIEAAAAYNTSVAVADQASADVVTAQAAVDALDPEGVLTSALTTAEKDVAAAQADMEALDLAVSDQGAAQANVDELAALDAEILAAFDAFVQEGMNEPVQLNDPTTTATDGNDIFFVGTESDPDITGFGAVGEDQLVIGSNFFLNNDPVAGNNGDNSALELWITAAGADTLVTVEETVWGSSAKESETIEVLLVGVAMDELAGQDGIIMSGEAV